MMRVYYKRGFFILEKIVINIENHELLDLSKRDNIEIMYLLSYRSYWYFSLVFSAIKKG
jgi:hypothetical protein